MSESPLLVQCVPPDQAPDLSGSLYGPLPVGWGLSGPEKPEPQHPFPPPPWRIEQRGDRRVLILEIELPTP